MKISKGLLKTSLKESRNLDFLKYLFINDEGYIIISECANNKKNLNSTHIVNPKNIEEIANALNNCLVKRDETDIRNRTKLDRINMRMHSTSKWLKLILANLKKFK